MRRAKREWHIDVVCVFAHFYRRKRSERGEMREIPENVIMRKLTIERIEELKQKVKDEEAKYK